MNRSVNLSDIVVLTVAGILTILFSAVLFSHHKNDDPFSLIHLDNRELHRLWQTDLARSLPSTSHP